MLNTLKVILLLCICVTTNYANATKLTPEIQANIQTDTNIKEISLDQLLTLVNNTMQVILIDSRANEDYKAGHIEDAISLPDTETSPESLKIIIPELSTPVVFYCNGPECGRSAISALIASKAGYTNIYWYSGGWQDWSINNMPVISES